MRVSSRRPDADGPAQAGVSEGEDERFIIGIDPSRQAFALPIEIPRGAWLRLAWPDGSLAREALRQETRGLEAGGVGLQFACRARDAALHGEADLEAAWVASEVPERPVVGAVGPRVLHADPSTPGAAEVGVERIHATALVSLGRPPDGPRERDGGVPLLDGSK